PSGVAVGRFDNAARLPLVVEKGRAGSRGMQPPRPARRETLMQVVRDYASLAAFKTANRQAGMHFFSAETMRFFASRAATDMIGGRYFVTAERFQGSTHTEPRRFTVREAQPDAGGETVGNFQEHDTLDDALHAVACLAARMLGHEAGVAAGSWLL